MTKGRLSTSLPLIAALLAVLVISGFTTSRALATMSWADTHETVGTAFGGTASPVTHFLEGGLESCYSSGYACYFDISWFRWTGSDWAYVGLVSHQTDLEWPTNHGSRAGGQNWPALQHGNSTYDQHGESIYLTTSDLCNYYIEPVVWAVDSTSTYLTYQIGNYIYHTYAC
jgi:hypothetical protein